ncbi:histone-lysine N-methyltransferase SMYD3-like isoform X2 [Stegodyphus dumicola]|uniref:histone-lysine N-methyltransferase SMYD3-like isoform X2 n=1 Tax=Stegodyphus dumicola TaxID=202533 RepID=UPI0015B11DA4|nr:histone-lysine N-methyltransferase SMYD3-like isoform X2 [Stegodyphus dumicola]
MLILLCKRKDWSNHKLECRFLKNLPEHELTYIIQLVGKIIIKVKGEDWTLITDQIGNDTVSFADVTSHTDELDSNPKLKLAFKEVAAEVRKYIGVENMPPQDQVFEIIGKVLFGYIANVSPAGYFTKINGFYIGFSQLNKSCIPNALVTVEGTDAKLRTLKKIEKNIKALKLNNFHKVCDMEYAKIFLSSYQKNCKCNECSLPYGTSVLTKIIDDTKAHRIIEKSEMLLELYSTLYCFQSERLIDKGFFRRNIEIALKRQEGVLGNTNILRMRLLALKCLHLGGHPREQLEDMEKLLKYMKLAYGEYYPELEIVYKRLVATSLVVQDYARFASYEEELRRFHHTLFRDESAREINFMTSLFGHLRMFNVV